MHVIRIFFQICWQGAVTLFIPGGGIYVVWRNREKIKQAANALFLRLRTK